MPRPEDRLRDRVTPYLANKPEVETGIEPLPGVWGRKIHGNEHIRDIPDYLCCVYGYFVAIEIKSPKGKPTSGQMKNINLIIKGGGICIIAYDWEDFIKKFEYIYEELRKWQNPKVKQLQSPDLLM